MNKIKGAAMFTGAVFLAMVAIDVLDKFTGLPSKIRMAVKA